MRRAIILIAALMLALGVGHTFAEVAKDDGKAHSAWSGVDEKVVERIAAERGREPVEPLINTDQGDLLLFVFLIAGAAAGFAAGYYWRALMDGRREVKDSDALASRK